MNINIGSVDNQKINEQLEYNNGSWRDGKRYDQSQDIICRVLTETTGGLDDGDEENGKLQISGLNGCRHYLLIEKTREQKVLGGKPRVEFEV